MINIHGKLHGKFQFFFDGRWGWGGGGGGEGRNLRTHARAMAVNQVNESPH